MKRPASATRTRVDLRQLGRNPGRRHDKMPFAAAPPVGMKYLRSYSKRYDGIGYDWGLLAVQLKPHLRRQCYGRRSERANVRVRPVPQEVPGGEA